MLLTGGLHRDDEYAHDAWTSTDAGTSWVEATDTRWWSPRLFHATVALQVRALSPDFIVSHTTFAP